MGTTEQNRRYYEKNKAAQAERNRQNRIRNRQFVIEYKRDKPCMDCGFNYPYYVMEFDHTSDDKVNCISVMCNTLASLAAIQLEIEKCDLVCANCHRERTHQRLYS